MSGSVKIVVSLGLIVGCGHRSEPAEPMAEPWFPPPAEAECGGPDAVLQAALADAAIARDDVGYSEQEYAAAYYEEVLDDVFLLPWFRDLQADAFSVSCFSASQAEALDHYAALGYPVTGAMWQAMELLSEQKPEAPFDPAEVGGFEAAMARLLDETGDEELDVDASALPAGFGDALAPVLDAMAEVLDVWDELEDEAPEWDEDRLTVYGHGGAMIDYDAAPELDDPAVADWVVGPTGPRSLYGPTLRLLHAIESADLDRFANQGQSGVLLDVTTRFGAIRVAGPGPDEPGQQGVVLLYVDLGGDDRYVHSAGANADGMPLAVMLDLGGNDQYGYEVVPDDNDDGRLASDVDGRYSGDESYGPISLSQVGRQGSGRFGVGVLFDLGAGADTYTSLRMSQGWAHLGVGVLRDDGGDDVYRGEAGVQGASSMGIGLLVDGGGDDVYETYNKAQGFAYLQAVGVLYDQGEGADTYWSDHGSPELGGDPIYFSPQMPHTANGSMSQGMGFGMRGDSDRPYFSGGVGMLRDGGGDDTYTAGVFAQGSGYWQALGLLADAGGNDTYDSFWYVRGGAAHYALAALLDTGGNDAYGLALTPVGVQLGSGHDFSIGVAIDTSGDDAYRYAALGGGASNCQGIGIFADNGGSDSYEALSTYSTGLGNRSSECTSGERADIHSIGLFLESGGDVDSYAWPDGDVRQPGDDATFGFEWSSDESEHGGAVDGDGGNALP